MDRWACDKERSQGEFQVCQLMTVSLDEDVDDQ